MTTIKTAAHTAGSTSGHIHGETNWAAYLAAGLLFAVGILMMHSYGELPAEASAASDGLQQGSLEATPAVQAAISVTGRIASAR